ncbi:twin-arginine translocase subunit TatB [Thalassobius vesicularis]|uniref:Sec-independent protein translocase protein TatB n=1 Tax=Thalassobius vesicularis TaxID=1294297 RepID=A0A4S3M8L1_9RHOB|nr:Sec-independent protein translocase protein TatB [Thalassobius vesicularis]THD73411.1 twin-arginine translocase subunit TatB [Thalassobius vesicularis]
MFDIGWTEFLLIAIVALIVVGPKDLPGLFRSVGRFVGKAKGMAREFSRAMEDAADESGVKDISASLRAAANPKQFGMDKVKEATDSFKAWEPSSSLDPERAAMAKKIHDATAKKGEEIRASEAAAEAAKAEPAEQVAEKAADKAADKAPAEPAKKAPAKKPAAKKTAAKTTAAKPAAAADKPAAKKAPAKKAAKKTPSAEDKA